MRNINKLLAAAAMAVGLAGAAGAQANTLFTFTGPTADTPTDTTYFTTFGAGAGAGDVAFTLDGYASLDGQNFYEDDFTLTVNGANVVSATFNLGGGGPDVVYFAPGGSVFNNISGNGTNVTFAGGKVLVDVPITLIAGANQIDWTYTSLTSGHAGFQGIGDEGWGLENITVRGPAGGAPEPLTWSLMIMGFGAAGAMLRRARQLATA